MRNQLTFISCSYLLSQKRQQFQFQLMSYRTQMATECHILGQTRTRITTVTIQVIDPVLS